MARKYKKRNTSNKPGTNRVLSVMFALVLILVGLSVILGQFDVAGIAGEYANDLASKIIGKPFALIISLGLIILGGRVLFKLGVKWFHPSRDLAWGGLTLSALGILGALPLVELGGVAGNKINFLSEQLLGRFLGVIFLVIIFGLSVWFIFHDSFLKLKAMMGLGGGQDTRTISVVSPDGEVEEIEVPIDKAETPVMSDEPLDAMPKPISATVHDHTQTQVSAEAKELGISAEAMTTNFGAYSFPPLSLLKHEGNKPDVGDVQENVRTIHRTFKNFGIDVEMDEVNVGPTVTRYSLKPADGVHLGKIEKLQNNLELALAASPIRIEAPIPGKSLVGIEVPNKKKAGVMLGAMLADDEYRNNKKPLVVSLGKNVSGKSFFADMAKMPHLLIAGATGSGKSVTVHNLIISLLYRNSPDSLRLIMIDPKRVELTLYAGIPHLLTPVIKDAKKAILALNWTVKEMERRYEILEKNKVQNVDSYHKKIAKDYKGVKPEDDLTDLPERMPYIAVFIDELADLMTAYPRELEGSIVRLAQMSRAVGIHLILSTQRPSRKVVTGLIKANVPTRIALRVGSNMDSRVILDHSGAEDLLGQGDMLYLGSSDPSPVRMQCAFISEDELKSVVKYITSNNDGNLPDEITLPDKLESESSGGSGGDADDELFEEARETVLQAGKASTSFLQRKFRIGYSRAARLMDALEENGVVGPQNGAKARQVLISSVEEERQYYGEENDYPGGE